METQTTGDDFTLQLCVFAGRIGGQSLNEHVEAVEAGAGRQASGACAHQAQVTGKLDLLPHFGVEDLHHYKCLSNSVPARDTSILTLAISGELFVESCE